MADDWRRSTVSALQADGVLLVEDGNHGEYRPRPNEFTDHGIAFIRAADMDSGRVLFESASKINETARRRITKGIGAPGDVLLSHKGTVGKVAFVPLNAPPFVCSPQTTFWRTLDQSVLDRRYLHVYLRSPAFHQQLATRSGETDMAPYVSLTSQRGLSVTLPPIEIQRRIGQIAGAFDDKIELNRRMNQTLEGIARAIFQDWFVDFGPVRAKAAGRQPPGLAPHIADLFPDSFEDSELGPIPKGWRVTTLEAFATVSSGKRPIDRCANKLSTDSVPLFGGGGPMGYVSSALYETPILITGRVGTLGKIFRISHPSWPSDNTLVIEANPDFFDFTYFGLQRRNLLNLNRGSTQPLLTQADLKRQEFVFPSSIFANRFAGLASGIFSRIEKNKIQSTTLELLRDALLPKLISGELRVADAERIAARAV